MASRVFQVSVTGAKSYVAVNQLRSGGRKRTERCIAKVRHLYRDWDTDCDTRLNSLRPSEALLPPTAVISTSPGKYQVRRRIDCSPFDRQESALKLLWTEIVGLQVFLTNVLSPMSRGEWLDAEQYEEIMRLRFWRILTTLLLLRAGYAYVPYSSMESVIEYSKEGYYLALRQTQETIRTDTANWQPWVFFSLDFLGQSLHLLLKGAQEEIGEMTYLVTIAPTLTDRNTLPVRS
jgi:hypothetical protein